MNHFILNFRAGANYGKTTALKELGFLLSGKRTPEKEIWDTFTYRGAKIGIASQGDYFECIKWNLDKLILEEHCDIVVCASRTKGAGSDYIFESANESGYNLITVGPICSYSQEFIELCKKQQALSLKALIDTLISD